MPHYRSTLRQPLSPPSLRGATARALRAAVLGFVAVVPALSPVLAADRTPTPDSAASAASANAAAAGQQGSAGRFDLAPGPLADVLARFANAAGAALSFDAAVLQGRQSNGLQGRYTVQQGFDILLAGSGYEAVPGGNGGYRLQPRPAGKEALLPVVAVQAVADRSGVTEGSDSYTAQAIAAGSKVNTALRDVPRSVSVLTRQQLEDQQITSLSSAMEQMPGVTVIPGITYYARGYQITSILADGSPSAAFHYNDSSTNVNLAKYDNVQLLRGPDALFSGNGAPSGSINLVRKKPLDAFLARTNLSAGRWDNYAAEVDVTGPMVSSGAIRGRVVAAHNDRGFFSAGAQRKYSSVYGVVDIDLGAQTLLSLGASHDRKRSTGGEGAPALPRYADGAPLPVSRTLGTTGWSFSDSDSTNVFAVLEQRFGERWMGRLNVSQTQTDSDSVGASYVGAVNPLTGRGGELYPGNYADGDFRTQSADAYLNGTFEALGRQHEMTLGADFQDARAKYVIYESTARSAAIADWTNIDPDALIPVNSRGGLNWITAGETRQMGVYANGRFQIAGPLSAVLGGRYATYRSIGNSRAAGVASNPVVNNKNDSIFTPFYALTYELSDTWKAFLTVAESYEDQSNNYTADWQPLDPVTGRSFELGVKGAWMGGALNTSATLYRTRRDNVSVHDASDPSFSQPGRSCCYIGGGAFLSQGVELEVSGALLPGWEINAGYSYDDNKTTFGQNSGARYATYTPKHILRLWSSYALTGPLAGWKIGGGVRAQSDLYRAGTVASWNPSGGADGTGAYDGPRVAYDFRSPGRAVWHAFVEYRFDRHWTAALNIDNLFDKRYWQSVGDTRNWYGDGSFYGDPRNVQLTLRGSF